MSGLPVPAIAVENSGAAGLAGELDRLLARFRHDFDDGIARVDYAGWKADGAAQAALRRAIEAGAAAQPSAMSRAEAFAYWANLYNALTLDVVLGAYPVRSIRDIRSRGAGLDLKALFGPWRTKLVTVEGRALSLDDIEHEIMRPTFRDPRVHYAVNCAALGCPNLPARAWRARGLEAALDAAARDFVGHPRGVSLQADGRPLVSSIYHWFAEDFGGMPAGVLRHIADFAPRPLAERLAQARAIAGHDYDWALADASGSG